MNSQMRDDLLRRRVGKVAIVRSERHHSCREEFTEVFNVRMVVQGRPLGERHFGAPSLDASIKEDLVDFLNQLRGDGALELLFARLKLLLHFKSEQVLDAASIQASSPLRSFSANDLFEEWDGLCEVLQVRAHLCLL